MSRATTTYVRTLTRGEDTADDFRPMGIIDGWAAIVRFGDVVTINHPVAGDSADDPLEPFGLQSLLRHFRAVTRNERTPARWLQPSPLS
jgi:hypothetical protein